MVLASAPVFQHLFFSAFLVRYILGPEADYYTNVSILDGVLCMFLGLASLAWWIGHVDWVWE